MRDWRCGDRGWPAAGRMGSLVRRKWEAYDVVAWRIPGKLSASRSIPDDRDDG
jgi:hypothetical protein